MLTFTATQSAARRARYLWVSNLSLTLALLLATTFSYGQAAGPPGGND